MAVANATVHDYEDNWYPHHHDKWSSPGVIVPIVAGVGIFIIVLFAIYALRRRSYVAYPAASYPMPPPGALPSEAPEPMSVEGHENVDYEAGYVQEHYHHDNAGNYTPNYGEQYYPNHDYTYGQSGVSAKASPEGHGYGKN